MSLDSTEEALVRQLIDQQAAILSLAGNEAVITSKLGATKVTLSDLPSASSLGETDLFLTRQGTTDKTITGAIIKQNISNWTIVSNVAALKLVQASSSNSVAITKGYYTTGDGGDGQYYYDASDTTSTDNGGSVIVATDGARWKLIDSDVLTLRQFGVRGVSASEDTPKLQLAINTARKNIIFDVSPLINTDILCVPNQIIDFSGYAATVVSGATITNAVFYANTVVNVTIKNVSIDASATSGCVGVYFRDSTKSSIDGGDLKKCTINLVTTVGVQKYKVRDVMIDGQGASSLIGVYISSGQRTKITNVEVDNCFEGFGVYNEAKSVFYTDCTASSCTQDGFVIISGHDVNYKGCESYSNGQSGFTTQRQTASTNTSRVTYDTCTAYSNTFDGFDLRGANSTPWGKPINITAVGCESYSNAGTGFYVVNAEDTTLSGCVAYSNAQQNYFIDTSPRTIMQGCRASSGASSGTITGINKAGILVFNSNNVQAVGCISSNQHGATQNYGIAFTGTSEKGHVSGGWFGGNITSPTYLQSNGFYSAGPGDLEGTGVFLDYVTWTGTYSENGFNVPTHTRPIGSLYRRMNGTGAVYVSQGGGTWTAL